MRAPSILLITLLPAALLAGCWGDSDDPEGPVVTQLDEFAGTWVASEWVYSPLAGGGGVSQMPISFQITVTAEGVCTVDQHFAQDDGPRHLVGAVSIPSTGQVWIVTAEAGGDDEHFLGTYAFSNGGSTLTMESVDDWWFDFDDDGTPDPARLRIVLTKI